MDSDRVLENIIYARAHTTENQINLIVNACAKMMEGDYSLLIIDSLMALFRVDYVGRGELSERQNVLGKMLSKLIKIAE